MLIVHSVFQDVRTAQPITEAMYRAGFQSVLVKLEPGRDFQQYLETLMALVDDYRKQGNVYLIGHSMGADLVTTLAAQRRDIEGVAALGFPVVAELESPLLVGAGAWDQVHPRQALQEAAGDHSFAISPLCDHSQETLDPFLWEAIRWHFGSDQTVFRYPNKVLGQGLFTLGVLLLLLTLPPVHPRIAVVLALLFLGLEIWLIPSPFMHASVLALWMAVDLKHSERFSLQPTLWLKWTILICGAVGLSWLLHCYQSVLAQPESLPGLPIAVLSWLPILLVRLSSALGAVGVLILLLPELWRPGWLSTLVLNLLSSLVRRIRDFEIKLAQKPTPLQCLLLVVLLLVVATLWGNVARAGYSLGTEDALRMARTLGTLLLLPAVVLAIALRFSTVRGPAPKGNE